MKKKSVAKGRRDAAELTRNRMRAMCGWRSACAVLLIAALAAFFVLSSDHGGHNVPTCNGNECGQLETDATDAVHPKDVPAVDRPQNNKDDKPREKVVDANGNAPGVVASRKTGARARVATAFASRFQAYINDLENNYGARVLFMGGIRPGHCSISSLHPCGKALDVCQLRRGVVDRRCHLPARRVLAEIAASHGLFEGGRWCNSDYGHAQVGVSAGDCGDRRTRIVRQQPAPEASVEPASFAYAY